MKQKSKSPLVAADQIYDAVLAKLKIDHDDETYVMLVRGMLARQTVDFMVFSIWKNMTDKQLSHFRDFLNESAIISPQLEHSDILLEFSLLYPDLNEKVNVALGDFFRDFVEKFNELAGE